MARALLAVALLLSAPGGPQWVAAQAQGAELAEARQQLDTLYDPLEALRAGIDRTVFDTDALGIELAFEDAETISQHVHEVVRFEPYKGVLRGAQGTLASGGGNAIDQALLVATLLWDAGYEAQIRGATLSDQQVQLLLAQLRSGPANRGAGMPEAPELSWDVDYDQLGVELDAEVARLENDVERLDAQLAGAIGAAAASDASARLAEVSRDYYWVAYRFSEGEPWTEAHPLFGADVPAEFTGLEASRTFDGDIPTELLHRFSFQVFVERRVGDQLVAGPVMDAWERPVANMYGVALTYASVPDGAEGVADVGDVGALMDATSFFYPMLEGDLPPGGQAFDMLGTIVPPDAASSPFSGIFQTVSGKFGSALGALGSLGGEAEEPIDDAVALTAQWFEFTFTAPGEEPVMHRRMVVDRLGAEARESGEVRLDPDVSAEEAFAAIASAHTFMLDTGRYAEEYVLDRSLESVISMREFVDRALVCAIEGLDPPEMTAHQSNLESRLAPLSLFAAFADGVTDEELLSYRPAPAMVLLSQRIDGTHAQVDVVANPRWTLRVEPEGVRFDAAANRRAGVWETRTEVLPLEMVGEPEIPAFGALEGAAAASGGLLLLRAAEPDAVANLDLPYESRAAIAQDLVRGYEVLLPAGHATQDLAEVGWWRVDPVTGETLGRGGDGRGQAFVEYLTSLEVSLAITAGFTVYGVHKCTKEADPRVAGCCIVQNLAMAGAGMGLGIGLGVYYGTAHALKLFLLMDVGANVGGLFVPTVCS